jgi:hypothetical protein
VNGADSRGLLHGDRFEDTACIAGDDVEIALPAARIASAGRSIGVENGDHRSSHYHR